MNTKSAYNSIERPALEPPRERVAYLDGWRGLAIIMVVIGHFFTVRIFSLAPFGVEFFFVLSGRLMAEILFVEKFSLPKFYIRRISRIFPALIVFSIGCFFLVYKTHLHYKPTGILAAISMTYNYIAAFGHRVDAIDHIWSLCIEEHAYIIMGIIAWFSRRWSFSVSLVLACIALASMADGVFSAIVLHQDWFTDYWRTDAHLGSIVGSAALYLLSCEAGGGLRGLRNSSWLPLSAGVAAVLLSLWFVPFWVTYSLGTVLLSISVCTIESAPNWVKRALSFKGLTVAGVLSYSIYLWQQPLYKLVLGGPLIITIAALCAAVVVGIISYYFIERPARRWLNARGDMILGTVRVASDGAL